MGPGHLYGQRGWLQGSPNYFGSVYAPLQRRLVAPGLLPALQTEIFPHAERSLFLPRQLIIPRYRFRCIPSAMAFNRS